jgi:hypothetical protein
MPITPTAVPHHHRVSPLVRRVHDEDQRAAAEYQGGPMGDTFDEIGFTMEQEDAFWEALRKWGLLPGVNEKKTRFEIVTLIVDAKEGPVPAGTVLYEGTLQHTLKDMEKDLTAVATIYDSSDEALQMHLDDQIPASAEKSTFYEAQDEEWSGLMVHKETNSKMSFGHLLDVALTAVRQAQTQPVNPMIIDVQKKGRPKNRAIRLVVWKLLEIFERDTGIQPKVNAYQYSEDGITGNFCEFAILALAPANLVERKVLGSNILAAYREWIDQRRKPSQAPPTT